MSYDPEFASLMNKYVSQTEINERNYWVLNMEEYGVYETYRTDKYSILEILQDIDIENKKHGKNTNYFLKFSQES